MTRFFGSLLLLALPLAAANHYIRAGASGSANGNDWTNAWADLPTTFVRGDTYYVADGAYGSHTFSTAVSGTAAISIKKCTAEDHGTDAGYDNSYCDGQSVFSSTSTPLTFSTANWIFDGVVGQSQSGHGFKAILTGTTAARGIIISGANVSIRHVEITSTEAATVASNVNQDGIYSTAASASGVTVSHCYIHYWKRAGILISGAGSNNWTVEHTVIYRIYSHPDGHGTGFQIGPTASTGHTIRYNVFKEVFGTGFIGPLDNTFDDIRIYGNLFWKTGETNPVSGGNQDLSQCIGDTAGDTSTNMLIYNNTFVGVNSGNNASCDIDWNAGSSTNLTYNNMFYDCDIPAIDGTHDYNFFYPGVGSGGDMGETNGQVGTDDPFVDLAGGNFNLAAATTAGTALASPYNTDPTGATRGADGTWDRGAYEYQSSAAAPPQLTVTVQ